jgi:restriction endonuclease Mrr
VAKKIKVTTIRKKANKDGLKKLLNDALNEPLRSRKGYKFEFFFENLMTTEKQFKLVYKHSRTTLGEVDYVYSHERKESFWQLSPYICVECKNWQKNIRSREMDHLISLIKDKSPVSSLGVFITNSSFEDSAKTSMKNARIGDKIIIVPFEGKDLMNLIEFGFRDAVVRMCEESIFKKKFSS